MSDFDEADVSSLEQKKVKELEDTDVGLSSHAADLLQQTIDDRKQLHTQRKALFGLVMCIVPCSLLATVLMMIVLVGRGVGDTVYIAFISATAVQAFALIVTMAKSLYPSSKSAKNPSKQDSEVM